MNMYSQQRITLIYQSLIDWSLQVHDVKVGALLVAHWFHVFNALQENGFRRCAVLLYVVERLMHSVAAGLHIRLSKSYLPISHDIVYPSNVHFLVSFNHKRRSWPVAFNSWLVAISQPVSYETAHHELSMLVVLELPPLNHNNVALYLVILLVFEMLLVVCI